MFEHVITALVHGSGYERLVSPGCSDRTIRRRLSEWAHADVGFELLMIGLDRADRAVDGSITESPCGGRCPAAAGVDRGKQGTKRLWPATVTGSHCTFSPPAPTTTTHAFSSPPWPGSAR